MYERERLNTYSYKSPALPSGLTPLTFLSQPHFSSSPRVHALVTAMAKAAEDRACTKAASRVPESKIYLILKTHCICAE